MPEPSGLSRRCEQNEKRNEYVRFIVKKLSKRLGNKTQKHRMTTTSKILPVGNLKRTCVRKLFTGWVNKLYGNGRLLTTKLSEQVCKRIRKKFDLGPIDDNGEEVKTMHRLMKLARKRRLGADLKLQSEAMSVVDCLDTAPMDHDMLMGVSQDCYFIFIFLNFAQM